MGARWAGGLGPGVCSQDELVQVPLDDHVLHGVHGDLEQVRIGGVCEVAVDLLLRVAVERAELVEEVLGGRLPVGGVAGEVGEAVLGDRVRLDLRLEQVHLVEEEDERRAREPLRVRDRFPQHQSFLHLVLDGGVSGDRTCKHRELPSLRGGSRTYTILVFNKTLVVSADSDEEEQAVDVLEAVDPLLTLRTLASNVEHAVCEIAQVEDRLGDTRCAQTRAQHILVCWNVVAREEAVYILEEAAAC